MAQPAEQKKQYQIVKSFRGINTKANRTALDEDEFSWLENAMPIGFANLKIIPPQSATLDQSNNAVVWSNSTSYISSVNIKNTDYVLAFQQDGRAEYFNVSTKVKGNVAAAGFFSTSGVRVDQWKDERALIVDPAKGYYSWDGNSVVAIGSVGTLALANAGTGFTTAPAIVISSPNDANGVQAVAEASIANGSISSVTLIEAGSGYNAAPTVTVVGGGGTNANVIASIITFKTGTVSLTIKNPGTGYTQANTTISITGGGGANATAVPIVTGGQITNVVMTNPGNGYTNTSNLVVTVSGGGSNATLSGSVMTDNVTSIATFSGRSWISQGRTVYYTAAGTYNDFATVSSGNQTISDSALHSNINRILAANNFLYIFGDDSINVFSDVRVTNNGSTLFTNTNVSAAVGTKRGLAAFPYFRSILFMNDYGVYGLVGSTTTKLSDSLDGIFPYIDFTKDVTGGVVLLNNIMCAVFNFYYNDPNSSGRYVQAVFFEKKWFITSQGAIADITSVPVSGNITIYGTNGANLYTLYSNTSNTAVVSSTIQTALWALGDPIRDKQALKIGVEATNSNGTVSFNVSVDNENRQSAPYTLTATIQWQNNVLTTISWSNNSNTVIGWASSGYFLYKTDAQQYGKYLGLTITSTNPNMTVNGSMMEYEQRARF